MIVISIDVRIEEQIIIGIRWFSISGWNTRGGPEKIRQFGLDLREDLGT